VVDTVISTLNYIIIGGKVKRLLMNKEKYKRNKRRVFEIMGIDPADKRYNVHHIIERADYKNNRKFWDASVPTERFDIDGKGNLFPLLVGVHAELHRKLDPPQTSPKKKRKKKRRRR